MHSRQSEALKGWSIAQRLVRTFGVVFGHPFIKRSLERLDGRVHPVVVDQGATVNLGQFWLSEGKGAWAASVDQPAGRLSQARIVGSDGKVLASATLS